MKKFLKAFVNKFSNLFPIFIIDMPIYLSIVFKIIVLLITPTK